MKQHARKSPTTPPTALSQPRTTPWITAAVLALHVARPLVAGDGAAQEGGGVLLVMLWMVLACAWLASIAFRPRFAIRFGLVDACVAGLVLCQVVSGFVAFRTASARPAINMTWEWIALGLAYFLVRQTIDSASARRLAIALMASLAVAVSGVGFFQTFVTLPRDRTEYERIKDDPQAMLRAANQWNPAGSAARQRFEDRLASVEPTATFSLTNSLAGFLVPWLVVLLGIAATNWKLLSNAWRNWWLVALAIVNAGCLVWTKSRTSYVAAAIGVALLLPLWTWRRVSSSPSDNASEARPASTTRFVLGIAATAIVLFGIAIATGGVDREVFSEAGKSLGYRLQYWQTTLPIVASAPLVGHGPGQFQATYTQFKLPDASEEVRDPHNLLLEVAATAGVPALLFLLAALGGVGWKLLRHQPTAAVAQPATESAFRRSLAWMSAIAGVAIALLASYAAGMALEVDTLAIVLVGLLLGVIVLIPWIEHGTLPLIVPGAAIAALVVNLLAAGGIAYPGVAGSLWLLVAIALNEIDADVNDPRTWSRRWAQLALVPACLLAIACYVTAYQPVLQNKSQLSRYFADGNSSNDRLLLAESAVRADPYSSDAARLLGHEYLARWRESRDADILDDFRMGCQWMVQIAPNSSATWAQTGRWYATVAQLSPQQAPLFASLAEKSFRRAVELYPTNPTLRAELARVLEVRGEHAAARDSAREALRLDQILREAGHRDKWLSNELRTDAERIAAGTANSGAEGPGTQPPLTKDD